MSSFSEMTSAERQALLIKHKFSHKTLVICPDICGWVLDDEFHYLKEKWGDRCKVQSEEGPIGKGTDE